MHAILEVEAVGVVVEALANTSVQVSKLIGFVASGVGKCATQYLIAKRAK